MLGSVYLGYNHNANRGCVFRLELDYCTGIQGWIDPIYATTPG